MLSILAGTSLFVHFGRNSWLCDLRSRDFISRNVVFPNKVEADFIRYFAHQQNRDTRRCIAGASSVKPFGCKVAFQTPTSSAVTKMPPSIVQLLRFKVASEQGGLRQHQVHSLTKICSFIC